MSIKSLKPAARTPALPADSPQVAPRPDANSLRRVAEMAGRSLPPAVLALERRTVLVNLKVGIDLADALADRAEREGVTQKMLICQALAGIGLPVDPLDLQDRTKRRVRGH